MKKCRDVLIATLVSFEFLIVLVAALLGFYWPKLLTQLGMQLANRDDPFMWVSLAPVGALVWALTCAREVLVPADEHADLLARWPDFYLLQYRVLIGCAYVFLACCTTVGMWATGSKLGSETSAAVYFAALLVSLCATGTIWYASIRIRISLRRATQAKTSSAAST